MQKTLKAAACFSCLFLLFLWFSGCTPEEKIIEKQSVQIGEDDFMEMDSAVYKTRIRNGEERKYLSSDFSSFKKPASLEEFTQYFHFPPVRQYKTGTCWSFATTSFLESELKRLGRGEYRISELYTVYWEFVEKARGYIRTKGDQFLGHGSEPNAVIARMRQYGAVPASAYTGLVPGQAEHDHGDLFIELKKYLDFCKENEYWDEEKAVAYVRSILDKHLGKPPETVEVDGQVISPKEYLDNVLQIPLDDYVALMSTLSVPFYTRDKFDVPDNWWHSKEYTNVPLDEFYGAIKSALNNGYTIVFSGDISEPGISGDDDIAVIPTYDIHPKLINQDSREFRFYNETTFDDHAIHAVGIKEAGDHTWFLIKDSAGSAYRGLFKGYYFFRDDYVKLKILAIFVHKDAVKDLLEK